MIESYLYGMAPINKKINPNCSPVIYSSAALIATGDAGFLHRNGQLSANRLQKKFNDLKMAGELLPLPDWDHRLRYKPVLCSFSEI